MRRFPALRALVLVLSLSCCATRAHWPGKGDGKEWTGGHHGGHANSDGKERGGGRVKLPNECVEKCAPEVECNESEDAVKCACHKFAASDETAVDILVNATQCLVRECSWGGKRRKRDGDGGDDDSDDKDGDNDDDDGHDSDDHPDGFHKFKNVLYKIRDKCNNINDDIINKAMAKLKGDKPSTTQHPSDPPPVKKPSPAPTSPEKGNGEGQTTTSTTSPDAGGGEPTSTSKPPPPETSTSDIGSPPLSQPPSTPPPAPSTSGTITPTDQQPPSRSTTPPTATVAASPELSISTRTSIDINSSENPAPTSPPPDPAMTTEIMSVDGASQPPTSTSTSTTTSSSRRPARFNGGTPFDPPVMGAAAYPYPYLGSSSPTAGVVVFVFWSAVLAFGMMVLD